MKMSFLDNVTSAVNRGTASVGRAGRESQLKRQLNDLVKQRRDMCAQLGASLYDTAKDNPELRSGREALFDNIANIDSQRSAIEAEIASLAELAVQQNVAFSYYKCPRCGSSVAGTDMFCGGCGMPIAEVMAAHQQPVAAASTASPSAACPSCGSPMNPGDVFCMSCGTRVDGAGA